MSLPTIAPSAAAQTSLPISPLMACNTLTQIQLLANGALTFAGKCIAPLDADADRCAANLEQSLAMITSLSPVIGYDQAAAIAHEACESGRTIREICKDNALLDDDQLNALLDPKTQTGE